MFPLRGVILHHARRLHTKVYLLLDAVLDRVDDALELVGPSLSRHYTPSRLRRWSPRGGLVLLSGQDLLEPLNPVDGRRVHAVDEGEVVAHEVAEDDQGEDAGHR